MIEGLIADLSKLPPSRALDGRVYRFVADPKWDDAVDEWDRINYCERYSARYTSDVDAALLLLPKGWGLAGLCNVSMSPNSTDIRSTDWRAMTVKIGLAPIGGAEFPTGTGQSAAIAVTIAALKARTQSSIVKAMEFPT